MNKEPFRNKRKYDRTTENRSIDLTVLYTIQDELHKESSVAKIIDSSPGGLGLITGFPLEPGHVLQWNDVHDKGMLHLAMVVWTKKNNDMFRAGAVFV